MKYRKKSYGMGARNAPEGSLARPGRAYVPEGGIAGRRDKKLWLKCGDGLEAARIQASWDILS